MTVDPAFSWILRLSFGVLFAASAQHKLRDFDTFRGAVGDYQLLPAVLVDPVAVSLTLLELGSIVLFVLAPMSLALAILPAALLLLYASSIAINLQRGRRSIDCGCLGVAGRVEIHRGLVARNLVLAVFATIAMLPSTDRQLGWIDAVSIGGALLVLVAMYVSIDGLLGQPRRPPLVGAHRA